MCIAAFWYEPNSIYKMIFLSNRDEFYERLSMPAHWWANGLLAGKDLEAGGTWLGLGSGRFATITNYRDFARTEKGRPSRGVLVSDFLGANDSLEDYIKGLALKGQGYNPLNLLLYDHKANKMLYYSNVTREVKTLKKGFYTMSNHLLETKWPKTERLTELLSSMNLENPSPHKMFGILGDAVKADLERLPQTGLEVEIELLLSSIFIDSETYGTRFQTIVLIESTGLFSLYERALNHTTGVWDYQSFQSDFNDLMIT